jgi:epsilon-lactone hydrolase
MTTHDDERSRTGREVRRFIPVPNSVSEPAQHFLAMGMMFGGDGAPSPRPDDAEAWRAVIKAADDGVLSMLGPRAAELGATVELTSIGDVPVFVITPTDLAAAPDEVIYLDIHGGGFNMGSGDLCRAMAEMSAARVRLRTWSPDYRMPPDAPYPAALDDCIAVYRALLEVQPPERIIVGGGSAGGNLANALVLRARDEGLPLPAALLLLTPEADLTESGDSFATNLGIDSVLTSSLADSIALYAGDHDLTHPYLSPLFGDYDPAWPPTLLQSGTRDLFLSNTVRLHRRLRAAGVDAELHVWEAMPHGGFFGAPEDNEIADELRRFLFSRLDVGADPTKERL